MAHVFVSYVHEDSQQVQRLCDDLTRNPARDVDLWLDKRKLKAGVRWQDIIAEAIDKGDYFLACFSEAYSKKNESYMSEEITLAIERLRRLPHTRAWFIPAVLSGEVPNWRIGPGETLRDLQWVNLDQDNWDTGIRQILEVICPTEEIRILSEDAAKSMVRERNLYSVDWNKNGSGIEHNYTVVDEGGERLILDRATGLIWERGGSPERIGLGAAKQYIQTLNQQKFVNHEDWRLPTLEEAMSLMEPTKKPLYINPVFDNRLFWIWTADMSDEKSAWMTNYMLGGCAHYDMDSPFFVRAVR
jgi:TIR domain-containing protein/uncharacterized protein DUF1566